jgi:hypothetical protein
MNGLLLTADHPQPDAVVTLTLPDPPAAPNEALVGLREKLQAAWVTVKSLPFTVIVV